MFLWEALDAFRQGRGDFSWHLECRSLMLQAFGEGSYQVLKSRGPRARLVGFAKLLGRGGSHGWVPNFRHIRRTNLVFLDHY